MKQPPTRIYVSTVPVDFRKGIDGLCGFVREVFREDPFDGAYRKLPKV